MPGAVSPQHGTSSMHLVCLAATSPCCRAGASPACCAPRLGPPLPSPTEGRSWLRGHEQAARAASIAPGSGPGERGAEPRAGVAAEGTRLRCRSGIASARDPRRSPSRSPGAAAQPGPRGGAGRSQRPRPGGEMAARPPRPVPCRGGPALTFTRLTLASRRSCCTTFFMAATFEEPDMAGLAAGSARHSRHSQHNFPGRPQLPDRGACAPGPAAGGAAPCAGTGPPAGAQITPALAGS